MKSEEQQYLEYLENKVPGVPEHIKERDKDMEQVKKRHESDVT